ncbi:MAG: DUF2142 domain-containing protein, partial [Promicromonosporaceae bacterium]|nr:DUF2142 domain-containing protein [Promicromonosporaceae bacterium]
SINPSGWGVTGVAAAWIGLHGFMTEETTKRRYGLLGIAVVGAVLAATSRGDTGAFVALAALAAAVLHFDRHRANWRTALAPAGVAIVGLLGFLSGTHSQALTDGLTYQPAGGLAHMMFNASELPALLIHSVAGPLNWTDTFMPAITWATVAGLAAALVFGGLRAMNWRKALSLGGLAFSFVALPLLLLQVSGASVGSEVQGRYLTPLVPVIVMTALWNPLRNSVERLTRLQATVVALGLSAAHAAALHTQIRRYSIGLDVPIFNLNSRVEWWASPVSPMVTWLLASLGFALVTGSILLVTSRQFDVAAQVVEVEAKHGDLFGEGAGLLLQGGGLDAELDADPQENDDRQGEQQVAGGFDQHQVGEPLHGGGEGADHADGDGES